MSSDFKLGDFVVLSQKPDWGVGQVQSVIGDRVTVNFQHAGKQTLDASRASLRPAPLDGGPGAGPDAP